MSGSATEVLALLRTWQVAQDEPAPLIVETSGSTGDPKRVLLSRAALRASATATSARLGGPGQWLLNLPPTYVAGLQVLFRSVVAGTEPVVLERNFAEATGLMAGERRYVSLVPTQLRRLLDDPVQARALGTFTTVLMGGAHVPADLRARAVDQGVRIVATYGMSETCGGCVYDGVPLDGVSVAVGDDGRVQLGGPVLFDGYDGRPELADEVLRDGWFLTQDLGRVDRDGRLEVLGRIDDVVVSGGVNVPTSTVAGRLREHAAVRAAEVVGAPDAEWGQRVVALVVGDLDLDTARGWVAAVLPRAWAPQEVRHLDEIPLLGNGKVDRVRLQDVARG